MNLPTLGLEEEVFVLYQGRPSTASLLDLAVLLWRDPRRNFSKTASNFTRRLPNLMSTVEFATDVHGSPAALLAETMARRAELAAVARTGLLVPVGMLPDENPYNTAGLHLHLGVEAGQLQRAYTNIARFLPVLTLASASSPWRGRERFGHSYRLQASFALGPLQRDPLHRFQDLIITRRLGTIELRALDPIWNPERLHAIVDAAWRLAALRRELPFDSATYNALRRRFPREGLTPELRELALELADLTGFDLKWLEETEAERLAELAEQEGFETVWRCLDGAYRTGTFGPSTTLDTRPAKWRGAAGLALYYAPKLPYMALKGWREHHGRPPVLDRSPGSPLFGEVAVEG
ncbi:hypothetical protein [Deinococcus peraridilitoris]|uniref:Glutamate--cysteine ligase n=1 Tax=Deinococcus peraridilitoris (strain DSM 19664 / LMG 22246 / CIP 109416 / KR-200) TaxID=937777 RepID=L0A5V6_DEIPD|nr:hypothetical protein [Deinococcus peraridilitoris]AFZ69231.1 hypothetical protein Deipe_3807 [Deinococcus peraridilitoris DSM 19664]